MNMTSRFTLGTAVASLIWAGCSSPAEEGVDPPVLPPPLATPGFGVGGATGTPVAPPMQMAQGGTGQTGVVPAGTGGSTMVVAGAGGAPVAAAGAGGAPAGMIPTGMGNLIMHDGTGWVAGGTNAVGIQGSFYTISDATDVPPGDTEIAIGDLTTPGRTCVSGTASAVPDDTGYSQFWGGGLALNLADPGGMMGTGPWTRGTVTGFSFNVTGPAIPPGTQFRFKATTFEGGAVNNNGYCTTAAPGQNSFDFGDLIAECWPGGTVLTPLGGALQIVSIQWTVATVIGEPTDFDFCVENLTAVTAP
jgi:hypothetical protein